MKNVLAIRAHGQSGQGHISTFGPTVGCESHSKAQGSKSSFDDFCDIMRIGFVLV
jgi:hypothetical protein